MIERIAQWQAGVSVPDSQRAITRGSKHPLAVRAELDGLRPLRVFKRLAQRATGADVPDSGGLVMGGCDHALTVWTERYK